jgi:hypothetical protein
VQSDLTEAGPLEDDRLDLRARSSIWARAAAALAVIALLALPASAPAQGVLLDSTPLNVFANGFGAIQVRVDGVAAGLFYEPTEDPAHAGLEVKEGNTVYPLQRLFDFTPGRLNFQAPTIVDAGNGAQAIRSVYRVGPRLQVVESLTYTAGTTHIDARYVFTNVSAEPSAPVKAGVLADLYVGANDKGRGVISHGPPRFVGGRDEATGLVYGLQEITPWSRYQEGDFEMVFDNFAEERLNNTVDSWATDNGVGVEWDLGTLAPGQEHTIEVRWLLASPPPPGTVTPPPLEEDQDWPVFSRNGVLPPPSIGKTVNAMVRSGKVRVKVPGSNRYVDVAEGVQVPVGSIFDTRKGRLELMSASNSRGGTQSALFYSGIFKVTQRRAKRPVTELELAGPKPSCAKARRASAAKAKKKASSRRLWGNGKGRFRTKGQYSSATVRGTKWLVTDTCGATTTRVVNGSVTVRDFVKRKNVIIKAGKRYVARRSK